MENFYRSQTVVMSELFHSDLNIPHYIDKRCALKKIQDIYIRNIFRINKDGSVQILWECRRGGVTVETSCGMWGEARLRKM